MDLLLRVTGWAFADACRRIEQHMAVIPAPPVSGAEGFWRYSDTFYVCRFPGKVKPDGSREPKEIRPLWWDGEAWRWKAPPAPRPLYWARQLPGAPVLIVEGEKAADAAARLFPTAAVCTWPSGCKAIGKADWSPLAGRRCTLWPDADDVGRDAMAKLAPRLLAAGVSQVRIVQPPEGVDPGWDLADADWSPAEAAAYMRTHRSAPIEHPAAPEPPPEPEPIEPPPLPAPDGCFTCLGFDNDSFYYQPNSTGQVMRLSRSSHTGTNLVALAPLSYWEALYPGARTGPNWTAAASSLFEQQAAAGVYSPDRIRGRGAWWDKGRSVLHLGDRLVVDGTERQVCQRVAGSRYLYQRLSALQGPSGSEPLSDDEAAVVALVADRFHWEVPASALLLQGWVTLAPVCGALDWRPHVWLTAGAGSGKSAILDRFVAPLLADMGLIIAGNATEAGIRQALRADALPVVFDEAESNEKRDQDRMQSILGLARVASSESKAHILKGSPEGETQRFSIRSMFLMSSIATALKQGADKSRFAQLTLRNPAEIPKAERMAHWEQLDRDLDELISEAIGRRLQARTISLIPTIRANVRTFTRIAAKRFDSQRLGDQYGTLLAGAFSLRSSGLATEEEALQLINANDWDPYSQATEVPDERRCIQRILQHQVRVEVQGRGFTRSLGELVEIAARHRTDAEIDPRHAGDTMGRHGLKVEDGTLVVSNTSEALAALLRDTAWANSWPTVLARLPNAAKAKPARFGGAGTVARGVALQIGDL